MSHAEAWYESVDILAALQATLFRHVLSSGDPRVKVAAAGHLPRHVVKTGSGPPPLAGSGVRETLLVYEIWYHKYIHTTMYSQVI